MHKLPTSPASEDPARLHQASSPGAQGLAQLEDLFDFRRLYFLLVKRWWIIALVVIVGMMAVISYTLRLPKIYESRAVLQVDLKEKKILSTDDQTMETTGTPDFLNTVTQAITSGKIMLRVIRANNLDQNPLFAPPKLGGGKYTDDQLISMLERKVNVSLRRQTRIIDITAEDKDPVMAHSLAVSMVKEFFREAFEQRMSINRVASDFLSEEAEKLKKKLEESEQNLQRYKEKNDAVSLEQTQNIIIEKLKEVNTAVTEAKKIRLKLESDLEQVKRLDPNNTDALLQISSVASIAQVMTARQELLKATTELDTLKEHYLPKHPKYIAAMNTVQGLKVALKEAVSKAREGISQQYDSAYETESKMEQSLKEQEAKALELGKVSIPYNVLSREVQTDRAMYESVISRMKETGVEAGVESAPYRIIDEPLIPSKPSKPQRSKIVVTAFFLLLLAAAGGVIAFDLASPGIRSVDEAETLYGLPALGAIPDTNLTPPEKLVVKIEREKAAFPSRIEKVKHLLARRKKGQRIGRRHLQTLLKRAPRLPDEETLPLYSIALIDDPSSPLAESYRTLRASIDLLGSKNENKVILFSSAVPEEGKTFTSVNCAVAFAQQGFKTVIIDGDLRRPSVHQALLGGEERRGFTDYLTGVATLEQSIAHTAVPGLSLITAGTRVPNPAELLSKADLQQFIEKLEGRFQRIIIDSAPMHAVSDTLYLAGAAHQVILVVQADKTPKRVVSRALHLINSTGTNVVGLVLNRMSRGASAGYYYYYYGDKYLKDSVYGTKKET